MWRNVGEKCGYVNKMLSHSLRFSVFLKYTAYLDLIKPAILKLKASAAVVNLSEAQNTPVKALSGHNFCDVNNSRKTVRSGNKQAGQSCHGISKKAVPCGQR